MSVTPDDDATQRSVQRALEETAAVSGRISLPEPDMQRAADDMGGGDASKAPASLTAAVLHPIEGDSGGLAWDNPSEL
jgi:hypothetical protein